MTDTILAGHVSDAEGAGSTPKSRRRKERNLVAGLTIVSSIVLVAILIPYLSPYDPNEINPVDMLQGSSASHWLGTDGLGRDVLTRLIYAARVDLRVAALATLIPMLIGTAFGVISGYAGGIVDTIIMRLADVVVAFPFYVMVFVLIFLLGTGEWNIYIAITFVSWVAYTRTERGEMLIAKQQDYYLAAKMAGFSNTRIVVKHILPNIATQAVVYSTSDIILNIGAIVTLGYLGIGIQLPTADWGTMIAEGQQFITTHWTLAVYPALAVAFTSLGFSLIGDGLATLLRSE